MAGVIVYSSPFCSFCARAKRLLNDKGIRFDDVDVVSDPKRKQEMLERSNGRRTVPQIFVGERHVGGCDDLYALDARGDLDSLLETVQ